MVRCIVIGLGDSGTSDGLAGLVRALGGCIPERRQAQDQLRRAELERAVRLELTGLDAGLADIEGGRRLQRTQRADRPSGVARMFCPPAEGAWTGDAPGGKVSGGRGPRQQQGASRHDMQRI